MEVKAENRIIDFMIVKIFTLMEDFIIKSHKQNDCLDLKVLTA